MSPNDRSAAGEDGTFEAALKDYFELVDRGERGELTSLMAAHPGCEAQLRQFLYHERRLHALVAEADAADLPWAKTIGDFRLIRELGRGGMGVVYEAEQLSLGRRIALKVLSQASGLDSIGRARFRNESEILARLRHPHIVNVFIVGEESDVSYYAMELVDGGDANALIDAPTSPRSLERRAANSTLLLSDDGVAPQLDRSAIQNNASVAHPLSRPSGDRCRGIATLVRQIADALSHAHASGVLHRDVKPSNILVDKRGTAFLSDFGLARIGGQETLTELGSLIGTLRYVAPEIVKTSTARADERSDVYALGASLWEMLAGRRLFDGDERGSLVRRILEEQPEPPSRGRSDVPSDLETIALCALSKEPEHRYQSADAMREDLDRFLAGRPISARRTSMTERALLWALRNRRLAFTLAASIVLIACGATIAALLIASARLETIAALEKSRFSEGTARKQSEAAAASEQAVRQMLYATDMALAGEAWKKGETSQARTLLDRHASRGSATPQGLADLRGFEWRFLDRQLRPRSDVLHRGDHALYAIAKTSDERHFVTAGRDSVVRWHEAMTGRVVRSVATEQKEINCVGFSPSGNFLVTGGDDGTIKTWNADGLTLRRSTRALASKVFYAAFLDDDDHVVCGGEGTMHVVVDVATGHVEKRLTSPDPPKKPASRSVAAFDGIVATACHLLLTTRYTRNIGNAGGVDLWSLESGARRVIHSIDKPLYIRFDAEESMVFIVNSDELRVVEIESGRVCFSTPLPSTGGPLALAPDGKRLVMGAPSGELVVWSVQREDKAMQLTLSRRISVHDSEIFDVVFDSDGASVLSVGRDGTARRTYVNDRPPLYYELSWARGQDLTPISNSDLVLTRRPLAIRKLQTGLIIRRLDADAPLNCAVSNDGQFVAAAIANGIRVWNCRNGELLFERSGPREKPVRCDLAFDGTGSHLLSNWRFAANSLHQFECVNLQSRLPSLPLTYNQTEWMFGCQDDGLVFREFDPEGVACLDLRSGRMRWRRPPFEDYAQRAAISRDGRWLLASDLDRRTLMLFDCSTGDIKFRVPLDARAEALAVADDGRSFFVGDVNGVVSVWNLKYGQKLFNLATFDAPIEKLCSSNDSILVRVSKTIRGRKKSFWQQFGMD